MSLSTAQLKALVTIPKVSGLISLISCSAVVWMALRALRRKLPTGKNRSQTYHRVLAGLAFVVAVASFNSILGTWATPKDSGLLWAAGNDQTCRAQAFVAQFGGIASSVYNVSLSLYYVLVIKYGWRNQRLRRIESYMHVIPWAWGAGSATAGLVLDAYRVAGIWCWVAPAEGILTEDFVDGLRFILLYGPLWTMLLLVTLNCFLVYCHVRRLEAATAKYQVEHYSALATPSRSNRSWGHSSRSLGFSDKCSTMSQTHRRQENQSDQQQPEQSHSQTSKEHNSAWCRRGRPSRTRLVARQCFLYAGAFYLQWIPISVSVVVCESDED